MKEEKKQIKIPLIQFISILIAIACIVYVIIWANNNKEAEELLEEASTYVEETEEKIEINEDIQIPKYEVDFEGLNEKNTDIVAWLKVRGTTIEHPVVQSQDNAYYLKHSLDKSYNLSGWIFADYRNRIDGTDKNIVIYGHNIKSGKQFGSLKNVLKKEWANDTENRYITFETNGKNNIYEVFSTYEIEAEAYYATTSFSNDQAFENFLEVLKSRSNYDYKTEVSGEDQILTLSTCGNNNKYRVVLHARKIPLDD